MTLRRFSVFAALAALLVAPALFAQEETPPITAQQYQDYSHVRIVRLSLVEGDVQVLRPETQIWEQALQNLPIQQGYLLGTSQGRAEIELESGATVRIAENTQLEFIELALADGARITRLLLTHGTATFYANLSREDVFEVSTPHLQIAIPENARFRLDVLSGGSTVSVLKGNVSVNAGGQTYRLTKGRALLFRDAATEQVTIARNAEPDDWDRWVADRDEVVSSSQRASLRYVNTPFRYGLADMMAYGAWYLDPTFGYVWQPYGISYGWMPYHHGRWTHFGRVGWSWVSYEPWGWVPYHYGRWALTRRGWVWVAHGLVRWHPGLVGWFRIGDHIGWCPLGPYDRIGATFGRPQGGVVVINTPGGVIGGNPNGRTRITPHDRPQFVNYVPLDEEWRRYRDRERARAGIRSLVESEGTPAGPAVSGAPVGGTPTPARPRMPVGGEPGIVYDRDENRFVNNPRAPARSVAGDSEAPAPPAGYGARPPFRPAPPPETRTDAPRTTAPSRPTWGNQVEAPRPPHYEPRVNPPPRQSESPRPSYNPPPRYEPPRPSSPPPRTETPRPTPTPRSEGWGSSPRPTPPPPPPPRGESRPPKPPTS